MDQPKIPTLKDAQKPQVKVKGLGSGLTLFDRLKQFKKKDLAFILAGLGTLFMAPLAEHFMMAPENGSGDLQSGFRGGSGSGNGIFGSGSSPYESGNNSIAQGGAIGGAGDIITPLNVRDPSALVMGPGAQQQPNAGSATPAAPPPSAPAAASSDDYKDALKASASRAASAAVKKSPLPIPKIAVGGSGLRGLGVAGGGSSASGGLGPINSGNLGQAGTGGGGLNLVKAAPNFRGVAGARGPGNPTGLDGTKKAGANAGDAFSRTGSALSGLNAAAAEQIPTGGQGFGGGGQGGAGANDKGPGGSGPGGSKSVGESLAFIEAKERMMENLKLEFEKRKLKDPELLLYGIRNDSLKAMASEMTKSLTKSVLSFMDPSSASTSELICKSGTRSVSSLTPKCEGDKPTYPCWQGNAGFWDFTSGPGGTILDSCRPGGKGAGGANPAAQAAPSTPGGPILGGWPTGPGKDAATKLDSYCTKLDEQIAAAKKTDPSNSNVNTKPIVDAMNTAKTNVAKVISARDALYGTTSSNACGATDLRGKASVYELHAKITGALTGDAAGKDGAIPDLAALAGQPEGKVDAHATKVNTARADLKTATELLGKAETQLADSAIATALADANLDKTVLKDDAASSREALKFLKDGPESYVQKEKAILAKLEPAVQAGEFASSQDPKNVVQLVQLNKDYVAARDAAKDLKEISATPKTDMAGSDQKAFAADIKKDIDAATPLVAPIKTKYDAYVALRDAAQKDQAAIDRAKTEAQAALDAATNARAQAQGKQIKVLNDQQTILQAIKKGP